MACFYDMNELGLPFEEKTLFQTDIKMLERAKEPFQIDLGRGEKITIDAGTVTTKGELSPRGLFTLRVCKDCRADWLDAVGGWFRKVPAYDPADDD